MSMLKIISKTRKKIAPAHPPISKSRFFCTGPPPPPKFQFQMQSNKDAGMQIVCIIELLNNVSSVMESLLWWVNIISKKIIP